MPIANGSFIFGQIVRAGGDTVRAGIQFVSLLKTRLSGFIDPNETRLGGMRVRITSAEQIESVTGITIIRRRFTQTTIVFVCSRIDGASDLVESFAKPLRQLGP